MIACETKTPEREQREDIGAPVELRVRTPRWRDVQMTNLSPKGFRIAPVDSVAEGDKVMLKFAGLGLLSGEVRWNADHEMGCTFERPLSPYVFEHIVRSYPAT